MNLKNDFSHLVFSPKIEMNTKHRVLIVGCGDLGMRIATLLLKHSDVQCWGLRRKIPDKSPDTRFEWIAADISHPESLGAIPQNVTDIVYCAAPGERTEHAYRSVYLSGLQAVTQVLDKTVLKRIVFVSSTAVYGDHGDAWIDESTPTEPKAFNGRILLETEKWLELFGQAHPMIKTINARLSGIYGPGRNYLIERIRNGLASAPNDLTHWVNRIHIEDAASAIVHLLYLQDPASLYLVTDSTPLPMRTLYEEIAKLTGAPTPRVGQPPESVGSKRLRNQRLIDSGYVFKWPDSRIGHAALLSS